MITHEIIGDGMQAVVLMLAAGDEVRSAISLAAIGEARLGRGASGPGSQN